MRTRKSLKKDARAALKRHYLLLVVLCAVSIFLGTEFTSVREKAQDMYDFVTGKNSDIEDKLLESGNLSPAGSNGSIFEDLLNNDAVAGIKKADEKLEEIKENEMSDILGRERGILAGVVNTVSSGRLYVTVFEMLNTVFHSSTVAAIIPIFLSALVSIAFWVFIKNMYRAILRRASLEARMYDQFPVSHLMYFRLVGKWAKGAITLLVTEIFQFLWDLTIIGGLIKHYSYFLVPYIVAENPDFSPLEAITLSRKMMYGHKWRCFVLDLSLLGWDILGLITFGVSDVFWTVPYKLSIYNELYTVLRSDAKEEYFIENAEKLHDEYLFRRASQANLDRSYKDVVEQEAYIQEHQPERTKFQKFFSDNFGLWFGRFRDLKIYNDIESRKAIIRTEEAVVAGKAYPQRLSPLWTWKSSDLDRRVNYMNNYTIWSIIIVFFAFGFIGWAYEVSLHLIKDGVFVNRGALHGPWLPIYGGGVAMIVVLLKRFRKNIPLEFITIIILCGLVEYFTSYFMELANGMRWWDYTGYFLNLNGRICAEGLLVFAVGGSAAVYIAVPALDSLVCKMRKLYLVILCFTLLTLFAADLVYSHFVPNTGEGITDYTAYKEKEGTKE